MALDGAVTVPLRSEPSAPSRPLEFRLTTEDGQSDRRARPRAATARRRTLADGREIDRAQISNCRRCRSAAIGWRSDGVACALTVAPPEAYRAEGGVAAPLRRRRPAICAAATAGRSGDRRFHDARPRRRRGRRQRRRLSRRQPDARAVSLGSQPREPLSSFRPALSRSDPDRRARGRRPACG